MALLPGGLHLAGGAGLHGHGVAHGGGHRHGRRGVPVVPSISLGLGGGLGLGLGLAPDEGGLGGGDTEQQREDLHSGSVGWRRSLPACNIAAVNSGFQLSSFLQHTGPGESVPCSEELK